MPIKRTELANSYRVRRPNGQEEIVDVYQGYISAATQDDPHAEMAGMKSAKLRNGGSVNFIDATTFKDLFPAEELKVIEEL